MRTFLYVVGGTLNKKVLRGERHDLFLWIPVDEDSILDPKSPKVHKIEWSDWKPGNDYTH